jgi:integrase
MKTFLKSAKEVIEREECSPATLRQRELVLARLKALHDVGIAELTGPQTFKALRAIEDAGQRSIAHRGLQMVGRTVRWAIATGDRAEMNFCTDLGRLLKPERSVARRAALAPEHIGTVLKRLETALEPSATKTAALMLPHVFLRPQELQAARWDEIDLEARRWVIPAARMKMRRPHVVPLSRQVLALLDQVQFLDAEWVFPGAKAGRPICENAIRTAMVDAGVAATECTPHGWRSSASTVLNERGWDSSLIELQLAHARRDRVAGIYDRSQRLDERAALMQAWSDALDAMRWMAK